jgi:antitoxin (DNA-binding transcriptional repressor) of toxin-antitoxin stability system
MEAWRSTSPSGAPTSSPARRTRACRRLEQRSAGGLLRRLTQDRTSWAREPLTAALRAGLRATGELYRHQPVEGETPGSNDSPSTSRSIRVLRPSSTPPPPEVSSASLASPELRAGDRSVALPNLTICDYHMVMSTTIRIADLKAHLSEHLRSVRQGRSLTVFDRDTPIARLVPYLPQPEMLIIRRPSPGSPGLHSVPLPPPLPEKVDVVALLLEERQSER